MKRGLSLSVRELAESLEDPIDLLEGVVVGRRYADPVETGGVGRVNGPRYMGALSYGSWCDGDG